VRCTAGIWSLDKRGKWLGNIYRPLSLNRYLYCEDEPVNQVDPSGLKIPGLVERDWGCLSGKGDSNHRFAHAPPV